MFCEHATISTPADECKQQVDSDYWSLDNRVKRLMVRMGPEVQEAMNDNSLTPLWMKRCSICNMRFDTVNKRLKHFDTELHHKNLRISKGLKYTPPPTPRCDLCSKTFKCIENLNNHIANSKGHKRKTHAVVKPFELACVLCNKTFAGKRVQKRFDQHCRTKSHLLKILQNVDKTTECG